MLQPASTPCPTCGAPFEGRFCGACGEKRITAHDYSLAHFAEHVLESLTHFDFKSLRALKTLVVRPGQLTRDYLDGRRRGYIGPVQLFIIVNIVFALVGPTTFRTPLKTQEHDRPFPALKQSLVAGAMADRNLTREEFERSFDDAAGLQAKTWIFVLIPMLALVTAALHGFRRYFFEHLILATHLLTFVLVWTLATVVVVIAVAGIAGSRLTNAALDNVAAVLIELGLAVYLAAGLRRVFGDGLVQAGTRALAVAVLLVPIIRVYRFLLFFVTLWTMH
jgi:hypothetical protein